MKHLFFFCFLFLFYGMCAARINADTLFIRFSSWNICNQPHLITCLNFEDEIAYTEYCITDEKKIANLYKKIRGGKITNNTDFSVCCKLLFIQKGKLKKKACLNSQYMLMNGITRYCTQEIRSYIDNLMQKGIIIKGNKRFLPEKYGREYVAGRDSLFSRLKKYFDKKMKSYKKNGDIRISVHCKSDRHGRTKMISTQVFNQHLSETEKTSIKKLVEKFFLRKIKWKVEDTTMQSDLIIINYKIKGY